MCRRRYLGTQYSVDKGERDEGREVQELPRYLCTKPRDRSFVGLLAAAVRREGGFRRLIHTIIGQANYN